MHFWKAAAYAWVGVMPMICTMEPLMKILPPSFRPCLMGEDLRELRLRLGQKPERITASGPSFSGPCVTCEDLAHIINGASRYSPWQAETINKGYLTISGGHRIGLCGPVVVSAGEVRGIRKPESVCIRIARDLRGIAGSCADVNGSALIIGPPGWGKTTLLRDLARCVSERRTTVVLDERGELFPEGFLRGKRMDVLSLCSKAAGLDMALRTMGPEVIAVDEITAREDCEALIHAANCGVTLLATAHAASVEDLMRRKIYRELLEQNIFQTVLVLGKDKSWEAERMDLCS